MAGAFLTAEWRTLAMINYEVAPALLEPLVPRGTELDSWDGRTFLSLVGFMFHDTRVRGFPVPFHREFPEVNLRFYVRRQVEAHFLENPYRVFFKWNKGARKADRALYVDGANDSNLLIRPAGLLRFAGVQARDPEGTEARQSARG